MFNPTEIVIQAFVQHLQQIYGQIYGVLEPTYPDIIGFVARLSLENIADSDAAYHDMNHTIMVTLVGQEICAGNTSGTAALPHTIGSILRFRSYATISGMYGGYVGATAMDIMSATKKVISRPYPREPRTRP